jgi:flagellar biosynthesis GTPase FlhF
MKILRLIKNIILSILGIIFFTFAIAMTVFVLNYNKFGVAEINENSFLLIKEDLSNAKYKKGDLVIVKNKKISRINVGDEIFTYKLETGGAVSVNVGIIEEVFIEESAVSYENGEYYSMEFVIGTADKIIPKIGDILSLILNRWGFLFVIVLPIFFIFISQIYSLIVEIKYGDEDDEDEEDVEEEERPRKKRIIEDEEEEAERPHKKRLIEEDEEEEKPRKRRLIEEDEEEEKPRKRRLIEEDEEEEKPRKKRVVEEDEEEERPRKKRVVEDDDEMSLLDRELEKARKEALAESDEDEDDDFDIDKLNDDIEKILSDDL